MKTSKKVLIIFLVVALMFFSAGMILYRDFLFKKDNTKVSVIIPVYNTEKYIDECLESVKNQTFKNMEIICVNDGSTDNSLEVLRKHEKMDSRVKIIDQANAGVSGARNAGMRAASGDYIVFIDPDDLIIPHIIEKAVKLAILNNADAVEFGSQDFQDGETINLNSYAYKDFNVEVLTCPKNANPFERVPMMRDVIWDKLWKRSYLTENKLEFVEGISRGEDSLFNWISQSCMRKLVKDLNIGYMYRQGRVGSLMNISQGNPKKRLDNYLLIIRNLSDNRKRFEFKGSENSLLKIMLDLVHDLITQSLTSESEKKDYAEKAVYEIEDNFVKKYDVEVNEENLKKLDDLKLIL